MGVEAKFPKQNHNRDGGYTSAFCINFQNDPHFARISDFCVEEREMV